MTPTEKMILTMIGAIATFNMKAPPNFKELYEAYMNRQIKTKKDLAKACKCSYSIFMRFIRELSATKR